MPAGSFFLFLQRLMVSVSVGAVDIFRLSSFFFFACGGHLLCLMVVVVRLGTRAARPPIIAYLCRLRQDALFFVLAAADG